MLTFMMLVLAGLGAGMLNALAGGGTFLSFPALVAAGLPPIAANATATAAALPGYATSSWAMRAEIAGPSRPSLPALVLAGAAGGLAGALLLLVTPARVFQGVVPWLLLLATLAFAAGPSVMRRLNPEGRPMPQPAALALVFAVSAYGGYFNGGLGILLLAGFTLIGLTDLGRMNGLKNLLSLILSTVSVAAYALAGLIDPGLLAIVGLACAAGGYLGGRLARRLSGSRGIRLFIILTGLGMSLAFFLRG